jgi:hypothetical protein
LTDPVHSKVLKIASDFPPEPGQVRAKATIAMIKLSFSILGTGVELHVKDALVRSGYGQGSVEASKIGQTKETEVTLADRACPKCNFNQPRRVPRESWMARVVMPYFGCYPWECPMCRVHFYRKNRMEREPQLSSMPNRYGSGELSN